MTDYSTVTPTVTKPLQGLNVGAEAVVWQPAPGKRFRLQGCCLSATQAGNILLRDGQGGAIKAVIPSGTAGSPPPIYFGMTGAEGITSIAADNALTAQGPPTCLLSGMVWGTEV
jgi:hypothetical protein